MKHWIFIGLTFLVSDLGHAQQTDTEQALKFIDSANVKIAKSFWFGSYDQAAVGRLLKKEQNRGLNEGIGHYNDKNFDAALQQFQRSVVTGELLGDVDTLAIYNCGLAAEQMSDWSSAESYYRQCTDIGYKGAAAYYSLVHLQQKPGRTVEAMATNLEGRDKSPEDMNLLTTQLNHYVTQ